MKPVILHLAKLKKLLLCKLYWVRKSKIFTKNQRDAGLSWVLVSCINGDPIYMLQSKKENKNSIKIL